MIRRSIILPSKALVLFSGGQDSTTCLYWAKQEFDEITTLNILYGQRHLIENQAAKTIAKMAGVPLIEKNLGTLFTEIGNSALIGEGDIKASHRSNKKLPASFVPGRNIILVTVAAMIAFKQEIKNIIIGVCQTDYSGYPDCRQLTISFLQDTIAAGMDYPFTIHTPLMKLTKKQTVEMADELPGCMEALAYSHTCYEGRFPHCRVCPACGLRAKGFQEAGKIDPLELRGLNAK
jgi:7-cyano-7-deazaguanine synthase